MKGKYSADTPKHQCLHLGLQETKWNAILCQQMSWLFETIHNMIYKLISDKAANWRFWRIPSVSGGIKDTTVSENYPLDILSSLVHLTYKSWSTELFPWLKTSTSPECLISFANTALLVKGDEYWCMQMIKSVTNLCVWKKVQNYSFTM